MGENRKSGAPLIRNPMAGFMGTNVPILRRLLECKQTREETECGAVELGAEGFCLERGKKLRVQQVG